MNEDPHENVTPESDRTPFPEREPFFAEDGPVMSGLNMHQNILIRKEKLRLQGITDEGPTSTKTLDYLANGKQLFEEMRETYGVAVPDFQYVIGQDDVDGSPRLYTMTEKIEGKDLSKVESFDKRAILLADMALSGAIAQLKHSLMQQKRYWIDIDISQFMLGRRDGESEDSVYLADLEPRTAAWWGNQGEVLAKIYSLLEGIESIESRGDGERLILSRAQLREMFDTLHEPEEKDQYLGETLLVHYHDLAQRL